jgi:hypothetical protein
MVKITRREILSTEAPGVKFTQYSVWVGRRVVSRHATYQHALADATGLSSI